MIQKTCAISGQAFTVTNEDQAYYQKIGVPVPDWCPDERMRLRAAFRNERFLYKRKCDGTGKTIISCYAPESDFPVYDQEYWWSDAWTGEKYARDFDFSRPFFEQFADFMAPIPRLGVSVTRSEECDYNMYCVDAKHVYMSQRIGSSRDCYYCYLCLDSRDCIDCYNINTCELCYEVIDGENNYNVKLSQNVFNCRDGAFLFDCRSCQNCFFCAGLRNCEYYFCNEKCSREEYEQKVAEFKVLTTEKKETLWADFVRLKSTLNVPLFWGNRTENTSGNYLFECKNVYRGFDIKDAEDIRYSWGHIYGKDSMDTCFNYHNENCYQVCSSIYSSYLKSCYSCYNDCHDLEYCMSCMNNSSYLLGCVGLKKRQYCIFNKAYSEEDFKALRKKIINHMKETNEWGRFFPAFLTDFAYNQTVAHEYFSLTKDQALKLGYQWRDDAVISPDKPFNYQKGEIGLYEKMGVPRPTLHPDIRYKNRVALRNPRKLWERECQECQKPIETSYGPDRSERVLCEKCYEEAIGV